GGAAGAVYAYMVGTARLQQDADWALSYVRQHVPASTITAPDVKPVDATPLPPWDGFVRINMDDAKAIGLLVVTVHSQTDPIELPLMGRTDYDPNTLNKIRPRFDTLVVKVLAELGQQVKKGDPLVDLFSTELAAAKNDFQTAYVQHQHDLRLLDMRQRLLKEDAISKQLLVDTQNDENKSRLAFMTAWDKLGVFGVPEDQILPLVKHLGDLPLPKEVHAISDKAKMTRLSPVDGIVIKKDAVPGNLYDNNDVLMVIAPLDHLFVWVNVYEADQAKVAMGQDLEIRFPYMDRTILAKVQYVASEVSKETRAIQLRASIPNVDGKLKADMLVRAFLKIPPVAGQTVIPRQSMVVMNGNEYAFVQKEQSDPHGIEQFERRQLDVAEERDDHVVVKAGLRAGEHIASNGSLVLAQLYEDQQVVATGMPLK
ncbi:MAG: efflux RND transporter periplasmic adaptor subunit, partial [Isosphaerales bacterium]